MRPTDIIKELPSKRAVSLCVECFRELEKTVINPDDKTGLSDIYNSPYGPIKRLQFNDYFLNTVKDIPGWENLDISKETYEKLLNVDNYYKSKPEIKSEDTLDPTILDKIWFEEHLNREETYHQAALKRAEKLTEKEIEQLKSRTEKIEAEKKEKIPAKEEAETGPKETAEGNIITPDETIENAEESIFISLKPGQEIKQVHLDEEVQEDLQAIKNAVNSKGNEKFAEELARKIEENLKSQLPEVEKIEFDEKTQKDLAQTVSEDFTDKISQLPNKIPSNIEISDIEPLIALTTPKAANVLGETESFTAISNAIDEIIDNHNTLQQTFTDALEPVVGNVSPIFYKSIDKEKSADKYEASKEKRFGSLVKAQIKDLNEFVTIKNQIMKSLEEAGMTAKEEDVRTLAWEFTRRFKNQSEKISFAKSASMGIGKHEEGEMPTIDNNLFEMVKKRLSFTVTATDGKIDFLFNGRSLKTIGGKVGNIASKISATSVKIGQGVDAITLKYKGVGAATEAAVTKAISGLATKVAGSAIGGTALGSTLAAALGSLAPIIGHIIGFIVGWIVGKILGPIIIWAKKHFKEIMSLLMFIGLISNAPLLLGAGALGLAWSIGVVNIAQRALGFITLLFASITAFVTKFVTIAVISTLVIVGSFAFTLYIINSGAHMVVPNYKYGGGEGGGGTVPTDCQGNYYPKPSRPDILFSSDHNYAFPVAPYSEVSYPCYHWDGEMAVDVFTKSTRQPIIAYTSGKINMVVMDDSMGGKYIILQGDDGRYYYYAHNCAIYVKEGDRVGIGDVIAVSDTTGSAAGTPEHLHFAINQMGGNTFIGGGGDVCPQTDFEEKFKVDVCTVSTARCVKP